MDCAAHEIESARWALHLPMAWKKGQSGNPAGSKPRVPASEQVQRKRDREKARRASMSLEDRLVLRARQKAWRAQYTNEQRLVGVRWVAGVGGEQQQARAREKKLAWNRKHLYGLTTPQWDAMFDAQGRRCAICTTDDPGTKNWATDHCHATGKVRGILCHKCNSAIGLLRDTPTTVAAALAYLEAHRACDHVLCSTGPSGTCLVSGA